MSTCFFFYLFIYLFILRTAFSSHRQLVCTVGQVSTWVSQRALMILHVN